MEFKIYMGQYILKIIEGEFKGESYDWYKESRIKQEDGTYIEVNFFLSDKYLLRIETCANKCEIQRYDKNTFTRIEKQYNFTEDFGIHTVLNKVTIYLEGQELELNRPKYEEHGDIEGFERVEKLL